MLRIFSHGYFGFFSILKCLFKSFAHFFSIDFRNYLHILDTRDFIHIHMYIYPILCLAFSLSMLFFDGYKFLILMKSSMFIFFFTVNVFCPVETSVCSKFMKIFSRLEALLFSLLHLNLKCCRLHSMVFSI